jgi:predicted acylesterase/phospholipase RssA
MGRRKVGIALGSGSSRGFAHIGILRVFEDENIPVDYIAGTSIGAYIGYNTSGGAKGVGISTTKAVIYSAITIFGANYLISSTFMILNL